MTTTTPVVVVTGASAGIGAAAARRFGREGYRVALAARRRDRLEQVAATLQELGADALVVPTDVRDPQQVQRLADAVAQAWGRVDVLVNNAGLGRLAPLTALDPVDDILLQVQVNLTGAIWVARAFLPLMQAQRRGVIVNVASVAGWVGLPHYTVYAATKFGLRGFTEALRREVRPAGIRVVGLYPGPVRTEFGQHAFKDPTARPRASRWGRRLVLSAEDMAEVIWRVAQRPRRGVLSPWWMGPLVWLNTHFPGLSDRIITRAMR